MFVNVLIQRPDDIKEFIVNQLKNVRKKQLGDKADDAIWEFPQ